MDNKNQIEYIKRVNDSIDYIVKNMKEKISIDDLAKISCFSKFHFHRIFKSVIGENVYSFVKRVRLQKAVFLILYTNYSSITEIAFECGFPSSSNFAFAFKEYFGESPTDFKNSKISIENSNYSKDYPNKNLYIIDIPIVDGGKMSVEIKKLPEMNVAYVRNIGSYFNAGVAWEKLCKWMGANGLMSEKTVAIGISYDDPEITPTEKLRYDACMTIPENTKTTGEVGTQTIEGGLYAVYSFYDKLEQLAPTYKNLYGGWLPQSGYQADDRECLEIYLNDVANDPDGKAKVEICIPVKPL
ncbi:GyrI-like domain-containing protein [bacterium]|nr:GyrI-like domain-containing protein [bacterium]